MVHYSEHRYGTKVVSMVCFSPLVFTLLCYGVEPSPPSSLCTFPMLPLLFGERCRKSNYDWLALSQPLLFIQSAQHCREWYIVRTAAAVLGQLLCYVDAQSVTKLIHISMSLYEIHVDRD